MPRLKVSDKEERDRIIRAAIRGNQARFGVSDISLAAAMGLRLEGSRERINKEPGKIRLGEMQEMAKLLKLTPVQAASIVLGRDLTAKEVKNFILM